jgi:hypothetical protein
LTIHKRERKPYEKKCFKQKKECMRLGYEEKVHLACLRKGKEAKFRKKMWYLYTMEFYSAMKKTEVLSFANKWMELENIILSEVSQTQKTKNLMSSLICKL